MISVVRDVIHPRSYVENVNNPKEITDEEKKSYLNVKVNQKNIKLYMTREMGMQINTKKIHC